MVDCSASSCPKCEGRLKYYDSVPRIMRTKGRKTKWIGIRRLRCPDCGTVHRELPDFIFPYKQYEAEVIRGVLEGLITADTSGYEDYPCERTMARWKATKSSWYAEFTSPVTEGGEYENT